MRGDDVWLRKNLEDGFVIDLINGVNVEVSELGEGIGDVDFVEDSGFPGEEHRMWKI